MKEYRCPRCGSTYYDADLCAFCKTGLLFVRYVKKEEKEDNVITESDREVIVEKPVKKRVRKKDVKKEVKDSDN